MAVEENCGLRCLNLGCGSRHHPDWTNIDMVARGPGVMAHDLRRGIPLPDASCDVVYHSSVLEHFRQADARRFMRECHRVLKRGGTLRVGVPDLERICQLYLEKLDALCSGEGQAAPDYVWMLIEMYDQTVREQPGGEMLAYLRQEPLPNETFVCERIGEEGRELLAMLRRPRERPAYQERRSGQNRIRALLSGRALRGALRRLREQVLLPVLLSERDRQALSIGRFRLGGEIHQWMYDRYSLARLMLETGFEEPVVQSASTSLIPGWLAFNLDTRADGTVIKPDSLFMEAVRPAP